MLLYPKISRFYPNFCSNFVQDEIRIKSWESDSFCRKWGEDQEKKIKIDTALSKKVPGFVQILENYNITKFCQQKTVSNQNVWRKLR